MVHLLKLLLLPCQLICLVVEELLSLIRSLLSPRNSSGTLSQLSNLVSVCGVGFLIFLGASKVFEFYTEDYADTMSLAVFLISLAVSVYFAEPIRAVIPINLLLLLILVHIVYVLIRWYVKGCMRSRGYY